MSFNDYRLSYQTSPIILVGGVAGVGQLPLTSILSSKSYPAGPTLPAAAQNPLQTIANFVNQAASLSSEVQGQVASLLNQYRALSGITPQQLPSLLLELQALPGVTAAQVSVIASQLNSLSSIVSGGKPGAPQSAPPAVASPFGQFRVLPGHTLMDNEVATYPLANQTVAANAVITQPLRVSLEMLVPAGSLVTVSNKLSLMTSLKTTLDKHTALGGWYNVATPSYIYQGCLLGSPGLVDETEDSGDGSQVQVRWVWNFIQPLLTEAAAQAAQNQAMAKISSQTKNTGDPPGSQPVSTGVGQPAANIVQNIITAATSPIASSIAPISNLVATGRHLLQTISPLLPGG